MKPLVALLVAVAAVAAAGAQPPASPSIFRFHADELWLNLHHFLYVLGRAEAGLPDAARRAVVSAPMEQARGLASLSAEEQQAWREAVTFYATGLSRKDAVFDDPLPALAGALAGEGLGDVTKVRLEAPVVPVDTRTILTGVAPIYRKVWWPSHRAANAECVEAIEILVAKYGDAVLAFVTRAYGLSWPATGYPVHLAAYANWAGAYSTRGNLLVVSSLDPGNRGERGLESVFHEGMHQWDDEVFRRLREHARQQGKLAPADLSHAMIFFTAGEAVRRLVPGYVPYAEAEGIWQRRMGAFKPALETAWKPFLEGKGAREAALGELVRLTATEPRPPGGTAATPVP